MPSVCFFLFLSSLFVQRGVVGRAIRLDVPPWGRHREGRRAPEVPTHREHPRAQEGVGAGQLPLDARGAARLPPRATASCAQVWNTTSTVSGPYLLRELLVYKRGCAGEHGKKPHPVQPVNPPIKKSGRGEEGRKHPRLWKKKSEMGEGGEGASEHHTWCVSTSESALWELVDKLAGDVRACVDGKDGTKRWRWMGARVCVM